MTEFAITLSKMCCGQAQILITKILRCIQKVFFYFPEGGSERVATDIHVRLLSSTHTTKHPIQRSGN